MRGTNAMTEPTRSSGKSGKRPDLGWRRDFVGYGNNPPDPKWPGRARIAVNLNLNYEAGGEANILDGDEASEGVLNDVGSGPMAGIRNPLVESAFEYGSRVGIWRLLRIFEKFGTPVSVFAVAMALERNPAVAQAVIQGGHEIVSHGYRWIDYHFIDEDTERNHVRLAIETIKRVSGEYPVGWFTGRPGPNTRRLVVETGTFSYDRDALNDELPYWLMVSGRSHLVIPYSYETNDNHFNRNTGFAHSDDFFHYMRDAFDLLYEEGADHPKLLSVGLHDRLISRPGRAVGLIKFLDYVASHDRVWFCRGVDIARHWRETHPFEGVA